MTGCPGLARATTAWRYFDGTFMLVRAVLSYTILDFGAALHAEHCVGRVVVVALEG
jgi:hypothetical protein